MSVKIEVNTYERSPARELVRVPYSLDSQWYRGSGYDIEAAAELVIDQLLGRID